jgi:UDP-N-acetylglucosamine 2-epimerase (non-hydrolysing)
MRPNQALGEVFSAVLRGLDPILTEFRPDFVLVQGDTATSTAAALAAFFRSIKVGHVEAGLRTGDLNSPWPEEANRRLTAIVTTRHYAPTPRARAALLQEGHAADAIMVSGNTVIDGLLRVARDVTEPGPLKRLLDKKFSWMDASKRMLLVTGHRRESFGSGFVRICSALKLLAQRGDVQIIYPVHLNPNVRGPVFERLSGVPNVSLIEPMNYPEFVYLMTKSYLIMTDSGGIQEEAPSLRKPVLVMRDTSERIEAVEAGVARLVTTDPNLIIAAVDELLTSRRTYEAMATGANPFGDGQASKRIVKDLVAFGRAAPDTNRKSATHRIAESATVDLAG